ncbi:MAG: NAD(P)H-dependent oxidoreductase [Treponema sp.]|nr:NAD(P)H-dependent oxidoreductase [Treponema sp.]
MKVFIVYCHPCDDSLTRQIRDNFIKGLESAGHSYTVSDLYKMNFRTDMEEAEYRREAFYRLDSPVPADVLAEQEKINACDAIVFIYPVFWSEAPAKLVGWFDRVWTYGFAYGNSRKMKQLEKAVVLVSAGNLLEYFERTGIGAAMKKVFLDDRLFDRVRQKEMIIFDGTSREKEERNLKLDSHLKKAFSIGAGF